MQKVLIALSCLLTFFPLAQAEDKEPPGPSTVISNIAEGFLDKLMDVMLMNQQLSSSSPATMELYDQVIANHALYCSPSSALQGQNCSEASPELANADIQISTLLGVSTIPESAEQGRDWAARVYARNMVSSNKDKFAGLQYSEVFGDKKNKTKVQEYATGLLNAAVMSVPTYSFAEMYASRKASAAYKDTQNPDAQPVSLANYLSQIATRMQNGTWVNNIVKTTDALVLQRQQTMMQAEQLFIAHQHYKQLERIEALLAALVVQNERQREVTAALLAQTKLPPSAPGSGGASTPSTP